MVIPARGGSKRLPRKNVLLLGQKPLIAWTIEAALASGIADKLVVSSDDEEILAIAAQYGAIALLRGQHLADDNAKTVDVIIDIVSGEQTQGSVYDDVILLQPTSPLRNSDDVIKAYGAYLRRPDETLVSVCEVEHPVQWCGSIAEDGEFQGVDFLSSVRSQDLPKVYRLNGAIYIIPASELIERSRLYTSKVNAYVMPSSRSIDIDTDLDFAICKTVFKELNGLS